MRDAGRAEARAYVPGVLDHPRHLLRGERAPGNDEVALVLAAPSSMTMRNSPRANAAMVSSMGSNANAVRAGCLGSSWGRAGEAEAGMRGKPVGDRGGNAVGLERREGLEERTHRQLPLQRRCCSLRASGSGHVQGGITRYERGGSRRRRKGCR